MLPATKPMPLQARRLRVVDDGKPAEVVHEEKPVG
jgi:hypothetical protein